MVSYIILHCVLTLPKQKRSKSLTRYLQTNVTLSMQKSKLFHGFVVNVEEQIIPYKLLIVLAVMVQQLTVINCLRTDSTLLISCMSTCFGWMEERLLIKLAMQVKLVSKIYHDDDLRVRGVHCISWLFPWVTNYKNSIIVLERFSSSGTAVSNQSSACMVLCPSGKSAYTL